MIKQTIGVEIVDLPFVNSNQPPHFYNLYSIEDCKTEFDISMWQTVLDFNDIITIGMSIGQPIYGCYLP